MISVWDNCSGPFSYSVLRVPVVIRLWKGVVLRMSRIVVKVGTSTLAHKGGRMNIRHIENLVKVLSDLKNAGHEIILVSSGAIGMGAGKLGLATRPEDMPGKQAAAAVGQCELMYTYDRLFSEYNHTVAQILLTGDDLEQPERRSNFENTLFRLLEYNAIPILNENDTMATAEISVGDNDTLGALVAVYANADLLILLSDIDGLLTDDPHRNPNATIIPIVEAIDDEIRKLGGESHGKQGTGGMITKIHAAEIAVNHGIDMIIANGARPELLYDIMEGKPVGTRFVGIKQ